MTVRRRDDSIKPGVGIDKDLGSDYTKQHRGNVWDSNPRGNYKSPRGAGAYQQGDADFLVNKLPDEATAPASRDIFDAVEGQSSDSGNRAVKSRGQP